MYLDFINWNPKEMDNTLVRLLKPNEMANQQEFLQS